MKVFANRIETGFRRRRERKKLVPVLLLVVVILASGFTRDENANRVQALLDSWTPLRQVCTVAWADPPMYESGK